jgi:hypothetical protein
MKRFVGTKRRIALIVATAVVGMVSLAAVALADNVQNDVVVGGNDTFTAGGSTTVNYTIQATGSGGLPGCDATAGSPATVTINAPAGVTATPGSRVFASCGTPQNVTFTSNTPGDYVITVSVADAVGNYNTNPATFTLHVLAAPGDSTPPVINRTLNPPTPDGNNGWYVSNVSLDWTVTENESPSSLVLNGCVDQNITADQPATTYTCSATSDGGSAGPQSVTIKRDATPPTISGSQAPAPNANGWNNENVAVSFACSDATSPLASCGPDDTLTQEGRDQSVTGTAQDNAGNTTAATVSGIDIDKTPPSAPAATTNPSSPDFGAWFKDSVTVSYGGSTDPDLDNGDEGSGVAAYSADQTFNTSGTHAYSGKATDNADNESAATTGNVKVDADDPTVQITAGCPTSPVLLGSSHSLTVTANDGESGLATDPSGTVALDTSGVGQHTQTVTATDNVGHSATADCTYTVIYDWHGFFRPIDNPSVINSAKAGSSIPVKFSLTGYQGLDILEAGYPRSVSITCNALGSLDAVEETATAGNSTLSYDPTADQYAYVWKTNKAWKGTCRQLEVKLDDGTVHIAYFKFT